MAKAETYYVYDGQDLVNAVNSTLVEDGDIFIINGEFNIIII